MHGLNYSNNSQVVYTSELSTGSFKRRTRDSWTKVFPYLFHPEKLPCSDDTLKIELGPDFGTASLTLIQRNLTLVYSYSAEIYYPGIIKIVLEIKTNERIPGCIVIKSYFSSIGSSGKRYSSSFRLLRIKQFTKYNGKCF